MEKIIVSIAFPRFFIFPASEVESRTKPMLGGTGCLRLCWKGFVDSTIRIAIP